MGGRPIPDRARRDLRRLGVRGRAFSRLDGSRRQRLGDSVASASASASAEGTATEAVVTDSSYSDADSTITVTQVTTGSGDDTVTYYVADVVVSDATQLRSAFAKDQFGENITETTSTIAAQNDAVFADQRRLLRLPHDGHRDPQRRRLPRRRRPRGPGVLHRRTRRGLRRDRDHRARSSSPPGCGTPSRSARPSSRTVRSSTVSKTSRSTPTSATTPSRASSRARRSASSTRTTTCSSSSTGEHEGYSKGVTLTELADIMTGLGVTTAYNLDGGGSSTMYLNGGRGERAVQRRRARHERHPLRGRLTRGDHPHPRVRTRRAPRAASSATSSTRIPTWRS